MPPPPPRLQPILALVLAISLGCIGGAAHAQTAAIANATLGKVVAASTGVTTFTFAASDGSVSVSGGGSRVSTGAVRFVVNVPCTLTQCDKLNTIVTVGSIGTPSGRAKALANFTVAMGTATLVSGPSGTNPVTFTIGPIGKNNTATFYIGADLPISGDDSAGASGSASSSMYVQTTDSKGKNPLTSQGSASAAVDRSLSITQNTALTFGRITLPTSGSSTVSMPASTGTRTVSGSAFGTTLPTPARGYFTITGEGGQTISASVSGSITLSNGGSGALTITTSNTAQGTQILSGSAGATGAFSFYVGGAFALSSSTPTGTYSGTYVVSVAYN